MRTGLRGVGVGSAASFALDWACAWWEAGKAEVRTRTVASASAGRQLSRVSTTRTECGMGTHRLVPLAQAEVIARQFSLPRRQGRVAVFVFERVVHRRGGEARQTCGSEAEPADGF